MLTHKNAWIAKKEAETQTATGHGDLRTLYQIASGMTGATSNMCLSIVDKSGRLLVSEAGQNERGVEHYREI